MDRLTKLGGGAKKYSPFNELPIVGIFRYYQEQFTIMIYLMHPEYKKEDKLLKKK